MNCTLNTESALRCLLEKSYLRSKKSDESPRLLSSIAFVLKGLDELCVLRSQVEKVGIAAPKLTDALCRLISGLLTVVFEAADGAGDPVVSRALFAQLHFMQGKEFSGQERAC